MRFPRHGHEHEHGHGGNRTGAAGASGASDSIDFHVAVHAAAMTAFTVVVFPWLWWTVRRGFKGAHVRAAGFAGTVFWVLLIHAFLAVDGTGDHPHLHGNLAVVVTFLVTVQIAAGVLRARTPVRAAHVWLGRFLVAVLFPLQWLTGIQTACVDTSTALAGHYGSAIFTFLFGLWLLSCRKPDQSVEAAVLFAGGFFGLLGDFAVTEPGFPPRRLHHLFLYCTFMAAGAASRASASSWPTVIAFFVFGVLIMAHQHGGHHTAHVGHAEMDMGSGAAGLTLAMHASSGVALVVAAGARYLDRHVLYAQGLVAFSVLFVLSQPEVCACWTKWTGAPALYFGTAVEVAAVVLGFSYPVPVSTGSDDTKHRYVIADNDDADDEGDDAGESGGRQVTAF